MPALAESNFLQALGWAILNSFWQMAFLWVLCKGLLSLSNNWKAHVKAGLATGFLLAGFAWFIGSFTLALKSHPGTNWVQETLYVLDARPSYYTVLNEYLPYASFLYLILLILPVRQFIRNLRYVYIIKNSGLSKINVKWRLFVRNLSAQIGIKRKVKIWFSEFVNSPVTIGYFKPVILIPAAAVNHLTPEQMEAVLLHELAHIRRQDYLFNFIITLIRTILYFNPFVRFLVNLIEEERETSCDQLVVQFQYNPQNYASALLQLEKNAVVSASSLVLAALGKSNSLVKRIEKILGVYRPEVSFRRVIGSLAAILTVLLMNAFFIFQNRNAENSDAAVSSFNDPLLNAFTSFLQTSRTQNKTASPVIQTQSLSPASAEAEPETLASAPVDFKEADQTDSPLAVVTEPAEPTRISGPYMPVNNLEIVVPELNIKEEEQVKATVDATKRILEEKEWSEMEKNLADALNSLEKEKVKYLYVKELQKNQDWSKLEDKLKIAYQSLDWSKINTQLNSELAQIKRDSIINVYEMALTELTGYQNKMLEDQLNSIPDSDVTIKAIEEQQKQIQEQIRKLKATRSRKIIRL